MKFRAIRVFEEEGRYVKKIVDRDIEELPEGDVLIRVGYSSLNYKDALSCTGNRGITKEYPHTPGIDAAGVVEASDSERFIPGDEVVVTGYDLGMNTDGGFGEYIRVPEDWVVKAGAIDMRGAMIYGTAGYTAGQLVYEVLVEELEPDAGKILVSGATGGVGSHAVKILVKLGYDVVAVVNTEVERQMALAMGAIETITREESIDTTGKPLLSQRWASVIDTVGGDFLSTAVREVKFGGVVATCGNVAGSNIDNLTVYPFILRAVKLKGVASAYSNKKRRTTIWEKLGKDWKSDDFDKNICEVDIEGMLGAVDVMMEDKLLGRVLLKHK